MADQAPKLNSSANVWSVQASQALTTSTELFITTTSTTTTSPAQQQREEEPQQQGDTWEDLDEPPAATTTTPLSAPLHNHLSVVDVAEHLVLIEHRRTQRAKLQYHRDQCLNELRSVWVLKLIKELDWIAKRYMGRFGASTLPKFHGEVHAHLTALSQREESLQDLLSLQREEFLQDLATEGLKHCPAGYWANGKTLPKQNALAAFWQTARAEGMKAYNDIIDKTKQLNDEVTTEINAHTAWLARFSTPDLTMEAEALIAEYRALPAVQLTGPSMVTRQTCSLLPDSLPLAAAAPLPAPESAVQQLENRVSGQVNEAVMKRFNEDTHWHTSLPLNQKEKLVAIDQSSHINFLELSFKNLPEAKGQGNPSRSLFLETRAARLAPDTKTLRRSLVQPTSSQKSFNLKAMLDKLAQIKTLAVTEYYLAMQAIQSPGDLCQRLHFAALSLVTKLFNNYQDSPATTVVSLARDILVNFADILPPETLSQIQGLLNTRGFRVSDDALTHVFGHSGRELPPARVPVQYPRVTGLGAASSSSMTDLQTFQLAKLDQLLDTDPEPIDDPNIHFLPDHWQAEVIRCIQQDKSCIVTVPAACGKSFVSYYVISRWLQAKKAALERKEDPGMVVLVAPTLALANQMHAFAYGLYTKQHNVKVGISTSEFRFNADNCDVLIVTDGMLAIFLTAIQDAGRMSSIKYIVFDELQFLSRSDYSFCFTVCQAPFIGLSATLPNAAEVAKWTRQVHQREVCCIPEPSDPQVLRWSDLVLHQASFDLKSNQVSAITPLHPFALAPSDNDHVNSPLTGAHCVALFNALKSVPMPTAELNQQLADLDPAVFLRQCLFPFRHDVSDYSRALCEFFASLPAETRQSVAQKLQPMADQTPQPLATQLGDLSPAILFCQTAEDVEGLYETVLHGLVATEQEALKDIRRTADRRHHTEEKEDKQDQKEEKEQDQDRKGNWRADRKLQKVAILNSKIQELQKQALEMLPCGELQVETQRKRPYQWLLESCPLFSQLLIKTGWPISSPHIQGLMRGVATYHDGIEKAYRDVVEAMFRSCQLALVISTKDLAVGINMPCKTVLLHPNMEDMSVSRFQQMIGRAGRRGFDTVGNVVFLGFKQENITHLLFSPVEALVQGDPQEIDRVLRIQCLRSSPAARQYGDNMLQRLLRPLLASQTDQTASLRVKLELLLRCHLINSNGEPLGLTGLVDHLPEDSLFGVFFAFLFVTGNLRGLTEVEVLQMMSVLLISEFQGDQRQVRLSPRLVAAAGQWNQLVNTIKDNLGEPYLPLIDTGASRTAVVIEFFQTHSFQVRQNYQMSEGSLWRLLRKFNSMLRKMATSLDAIASSLPPEDIAFCHMLIQVSKRFSEDFKCITY